MLFKFLKYSRPVWYFNLYQFNGESVFPDTDDIAESNKELITFDDNYTSEEATRRDASWQAFQKGYIGNAKKLQWDSSLPLIDEYRFIRKYHKSFWANYSCFIRIITFHNPIKELKYWYQTKNVKQVDLFSKPIVYDFDTFKSELLMKGNKVSVIIPTLNRYEYLKDVLKDLEKQNYTNFDVIVIDQSEPFQKEFYKNFKLDIKVRYQEEKALWLARNTAIKMSDADYLLLFDDDSRVEVDWIQNHIKGLNFFNAAISSGQSIAKMGDELPVNYQYFRVSDLLDTGNVLIKREVFKTIGFFDRQFEKQRMGDGEFGLRAYLNGFLNISNPYATRLHLKVDSGGLRQMGSWDAFRPKKWLAPRPIPSVLYLYRSYFGRKLTILALIKSVPPSIIPYRFKKNKKMLVLGVIMSILLIPVLFIQVAKSWKLASEKINQGALINECN